MAVQVTGTPPEHTPAWQVAPVTHALPVLHAVPLGSGTTPHAPVAGLHVSDCWHDVGAGHITGLPPTQAPFWQVSVCVQALPSLQALPVRRVQAPLADAPAATEQAVHTPPLQAALQQTPSTQKPLAQSEPPPHAAPSVFVPSRSSELERNTVFAASEVPPAARTRPFPSSVAVKRVRGEFIDALGAQALVVAV